MCLDFTTILFHQNDSSAYQYNDISFYSIKINYILALDLDNYFLSFSKEWILVTVNRILHSDFIDKLINYVNEVRFCNIFKRY